MSEATSPPLPIADQPTGNSLSIALAGNPNAGKTTLFNRLTGLRAKTANYPGTTVDHRQSPLTLGDHTHTLVDLPGAYSMDGFSPEEQVTRDVLLGNLGSPAIPDVIVLVLDATHLTRNLVFASQVLELGKPTIVALNMIDEARREGIDIDEAQLSKELGCPVVSLSARFGEGVERMRALLAQTVQQTLQHESSQGCQSQVCGACGGCQYAARYTWAADLASRSTHGPAIERTRIGETIDRLVTHRWLGLGFFAVLMALVFALIFALASYPMGWIEWLFEFASQAVGQLLPAGDFSDLLTEGVISGVGGMLVFLPQIFVLFFVLTLLEDSGYLARAAFVMDRLMYRVGLPGKAFIPLLAAHACAIPAVMGSRVIDNFRDRLNTILIIPLMTCSARLPVFAMVVALLFPHNPLYAGLLFSGAYAVAIVGALLVSFVFRRTILPGKTKPLVIELPPYRFPSLINALLTAIEQSRLFVRKAGTTILVFSLVLWALGTYPKATLESLSPEWNEQLADAQELGDQEHYDRLYAEAQSEYSLAGRMGKAVQPLFAPLGFDWRLSVGVINSFAAREVIVSTLVILYGSTDEDQGLLSSLRSARTPDGATVFDTPTCLSLLIFYIFAMQCFPTLVVVKRELKGWKWPMFQLAYMTALAYVAAWITYNVASAYT